MQFDNMSEHTENLSLLGILVAILVVIRRPYKSIRTTLIEVSSVYFITMVGGTILVDNTAWTVPTCYATASIIGYFAPCIIELVLVLFKTTCAGAEKVDVARIIHNKFGDKDGENKS